MDPSLLREREAFRKRAFLNPVVESRKKDISTESKKKAKPASQKPSNQKPKGEFNYKSYSGSSQHNFAVLAKIVKHMKQRHLNGDDYPLTLEEILDETNQLDLGSRQKNWLITEALQTNPKIDILPDGKYAFKPMYNIKDRKGLVRLLDKHDQRGMGGILYDDVQESLPNIDKALRILGDSVIEIVQPVSKKRVLFYNDKSTQYKIDEEFQKLWRGCAVDNLDDDKIDEYLQKQGITSMKDVGVKKATPVQKRKKPTNRNRNYKKLNHHMSDILQDYSEG